MDSIVVGKERVPVQAASQQDPAAAMETVNAIKPDAGLRSLDHYKNKLPPWRYTTRQKLIPLIRWETEYLSRLQNAMRSSVLDSYFSVTANLGTHTFFMIFLPILFWCGYTNLGRGMVHILASGVFLSGFVKDMLCLPRPLSPPLTRMSMSHSASLEYGFPSTHVTNAVSVAVYALFMLRSSASSINPTLKTTLEASMYCYAASITLGRLYCGMHGFFDVFIGGLLGAVISLLQCLYGDLFDDLVFQGSTTALFGVILVILILVRIHPEPADDCPCFDDSVAFAGVMIGVEAGNWHYAQTGLGWDVPVPGTVPFDLYTMGWPRAVARVVVGVGIVFAWRGLMKPALLKYLPPLFRVVESLGLSLPRKFFIQASMYTKIPKNLKTDNVIPPISEIPSLITSLRHPRKSRSESIGPQSEADAYEALALNERRRRESNPSASRLRQSTRSQDSDKNDTAYFNKTATSGQPEVLRMSGLPTPKPSRPDLYGDLLSSDVFIDSPLTPGTLPSAATTPDRRPSEDQRQYEKEKREMFSMLEKPRVRYDVEVVTKLIVYTGI
ncbi:MAG: hypothetical protein Q9222_007175 [Ikaeria aurantiellina]